MPFSDDDLLRLETTIRERRPQSFLKELDRFHRRYRGDPETQFVACESLRRIGMFERGYTWVALEGRPREQLSVGSIEGRRLLWAARFLNLMGASEFALELIRYLRLEGASPAAAEAHRIVGTMYLASFAHAEALRHFRRWAEIEPDLGSYRSRLNRMNLSDCHAGVGDYDEAVRLALSVFKETTSPQESLLRGIALGSAGEFECRRRRYDAALGWLEQAVGHFPPQDTTPDRAFVEKWRGFALCRLGRGSEGHACLARAFDWLRAAKLRPETWLDVLRLQKEVGAPVQREHLDSLTCFPGLAPGFKRLLGEATDHVPALPAQGWIDFCANEYRLSDAGPCLGIPKELLLVAYLQLAHPWGLSRVRIKSILWPDSAHAFLQLESRLAKLIQRLRSIHQIHLELHDSVLRLGAELPIRITQNPDSLPSFLRERNEPFSRDSLANYYGLSTTQSWTWIRRWIERSWVEPNASANGARKGARYRVSSAFRTIPPS